MKVYFMEILIPADGFVKSSVELSALSNGTTKTITVAANQKVTLDCFVQGNFFLKNYEYNAPIRDLDVTCAVILNESI